MKETDTDYDFATILDEEIDLPEHEQNKHCQKVMHNHGKRIGSLEIQMDRLMTVLKIAGVVFGVFGAGILTIGWNIAVGIHDMSLSNAQLVVKVSSIEKRMELDGK